MLKFMAPLLILLSLLFAGCGGGGGGATSYVSGPIGGSDGGTSGNSGSGNSGGGGSGGGANGNGNGNAGGGSSSVSTIDVVAASVDGPISGSIISLMSLQKGRLAQAKEPTNQDGESVISVAKADLATINNNDIIYAHAVSQPGSTVTTSGGSTALEAGQAELRSILPTDALKSLGTSDLSTVDSSTPGLGSLTNALTISHITNAKVILLESKVSQITTTDFKLGETLTDTTTQAMILAKNQLPSVESEIGTSEGAAKLLAIAAATKTLIEEVQDSVELSGGTTRSLSDSHQTLTDLASGLIELGDSLKSLVENQVSNVIAEVTTGIHKGNLGTPLSTEAFNSENVLANLTKAVTLSFSLSGALPFERVNWLGSGNRSGFITFPSTEGSSSIEMQIGAIYLSQRSPFIGYTSGPDKPTLYYYNPNTTLQTFPFLGFCLAPQGIPAVCGIGPTREAWSLPTTLGQTGEFIHKGWNHSSSSQYSVDLRLITTPSLGKAMRAKAGNATTFPADIPAVLDDVMLFPYRLTTSGGNLSGSSTREFILGEGVLPNGRNIALGLVAENGFFQAYNSEGMKYLEKTWIGYDTWPAETELSGKRAVQELGSYSEEGIRNAYAILNEIIRTAPSNTEVRRQALILRGAANLMLHFQNHHEGSLGALLQKLNPTITNSELLQFAASFGKNEDGTLDLTKLQGIRDLQNYFDADSNGLIDILEKSLEDFQLAIADYQGGKNSYTTLATLPNRNLNTLIQIKDVHALIGGLYAIKFTLEYVAAHHLDPSVTSRSNALTQMGYTGDFSNLNTLQAAINAQQVESEFPLAKLIVEDSSLFQADSSKLQAARQSLEHALDYSARFLSALLETGGGADNSSFYTTPEKLPDLKLQFKTLLSSLNNLRKGYDPSLAVDGELGQNWYHHTPVKADENRKVGLHALTTQDSGFDSSYVFTGEITKIREYTQNWWEPPTYREINRTERFSKLDLGYFFDNSLRNHLTDRGQFSITESTTMTQAVEYFCLNPNSNSALNTLFSNHVATRYDSKCILTPYGTEFSYAKKTDEVTISTAVNLQSTQPLQVVTQNDLWSAPLTERESTTLGEILQTSRISMLHYANAVGRPDQGLAIQEITQFPANFTLSSTVNGFVPASSDLRHLSYYGNLYQAGMYVHSGDWRGFYPQSSFSVGSSSPRFVNNSLYLQRLHMKSSVYELGYKTEHLLKVKEHRDNNSSLQ